MAQSLLAQSALMSLNSTGHTSNLRRFLLKLSKQLTDDNVDQLKFLVEDYVDDAPKTKNALDLFRKLQKAGVICDANVDTLIELLGDIERDDLVQKVIAFKEDNIEAVFAMSMPAYRQQQPLVISSEPGSANPSVPTNGGLLGPDMPNKELKFNRDKSVNSLHGPKILANGPASDMVAQKPEINKSGVALASTFPDNEPESTIPGDQADPVETSVPDNVIGQDIQVSKPEENVPVNDLGQNKPENIQQLSQNMAAIELGLDDPVIGTESNTSFNNLHTEIPFKNIESDMSSNKIESEIPVMIEPNMPANKLELDTQAKEFVKNVLSTDTPVEGLKPNMPTKNIELDTPVEGLESNVPAKKQEAIESDTPVKGLEPNMPTKNIELDTPVKGLEPNVPAQNIVLDSQAKELEKTVLVKKVESDTIVRGFEPNVPAQNLELDPRVKELGPIMPAKKQEAIESDTPVNIPELNKPADVLEPCNPPVICVSNIPEDKEVPKIQENEDGPNMPANVLDKEESHEPNVDVIVESDTTISIIDGIKNTQMESLAHNSKNKSFDSYASENLPTGYILEMTPEDKPTGPVTANDPLHNNENLKPDNAQNDSKNKTNNSLSSSSFELSSVSGLEPEPPSPPVQHTDVQMQHKQNDVPNEAVQETHDSNDKYMTEPVFPTCTTAPQSSFHILTMPERNSGDLNLQGPDSPLSTLTLPSLTLPKNVVRDGLDPDAQLSDATQGTAGHLIELTDNSSDECEPLEELSDSDEQETVELRPYQENLAAPSLKKENTIICCPTGSGKTLTAAYICHRLRREAMEINNGEKHFKTVFIVCIRNLKEQQMNNFKLLEFGDGVLATIDDESDVFEVIRSRDVVFMTAQVLVNTLKSGRLKITDLDFIIIDECHHTTKGHPYNVIMQEFYLQEKERQPIEGRGSLPQILGLTATLGVGENERPIDHCINMCANLDCKSVTHVREKKYLDNLKKYRPPLQTDKIEAVPPRNSKDPFLKIIQGLMNKICQKYKFSCNHEEGSEGYEGWAIGLKKGAESDKNWEHASAASYLVMYTRVIQTTIQLRRIDGLRVIEDEADELCPQRKSPEVWDDELRESLEEWREDLTVLCNEETIDANPMIEKLRDLLAKLMRDKNSRGLILARTKSYTIALVNFIKDLKMPDVHVDRIVGKANEDSQTDRRQMNILEQFREGKINVLVGTDVVQEGLDIPKCNFVIRYNFVSNEIGSVQGKGRARHVDSRCYLIVPKGSTNEKRENANLLKVEQMEAALKELDNKDPDVLKRDILRAQDKMMEVYRNKKRRNEDPLYNINPHSITLYHKGCSEELCKGSDMLRKSTSDYICVSEYFINNKIKLESRGKARQFRTDTHIGVSVCNACQTELGIVKEYTYGNRLRGYLLSANRVMFSIDGEEGLRHIKKWSKVPWKINEEA